jgi:hypothetical protein
MAGQRGLPVAAARRHDFGTGALPLLMPHTSCARAQTHEQSHLELANNVCTPGQACQLRDLRPWSGPWSGPWSAPPRAGRARHGPFRAGDRLDWRAAALGQRAWSGDPARGSVPYNRRSISIPMRLVLSSESRAFVRAVVVVRYCVQAVSVPGTPPGKRRHTMRATNARVPVGARAAMRAAGTESPSFRGRGVFHPLGCEWRHGQHRRRRLLGGSTVPERGARRATPVAAVLIGFREPNAAAAGIKAARAP